MSREESMIGVQVCTFSGCGRASTAFVSKSERNWQDPAGTMTGADVTLYAYHCSNHKEFAVSLVSGDFD